MKRLLLSLLLPLCASAQVTLTINHQNNSFYITNHYNKTIMWRLMTSTNAGATWTNAHYPLQWFQANPGRQTITYHWPRTNVARWYKLETKTP